MLRVGIIGPNFYQEHACSVFDNGPGILFPTLEELELDNLRIQQDEATADTVSVSTTLPEQLIPKKGYITDLHAFHI